MSQNKRFHNNYLGLQYPNSIFYTFWLTFLIEGEGLKSFFSDLPLCWYAQKSFKYCNTLALFHRTLYTEISWTSIPLKTWSPATRRSRWQHDWDESRSSETSNRLLTSLMSTSIMNFSISNCCDRAPAASTARTMHRGAPSWKWKFLPKSVLNVTFLTLTFKTFTLDHFLLENGIFHENFLNC